jgi:gamma-glutamyl-gamma-aminobutyrate hydrolase PuuD
LKIGLTQRVLYHNGWAYDSIEHGWYSYLQEHTLTYIPNRLDQDFEDIADRLDALIITGGDDGIMRRNVELKIATQMMYQKKPILGVCHGCFLLQDVLGGQISEIDNHYNTEHWVSYFGELVPVNSYHNLSITKVHDQGTVLCVDHEGNCEAWIEGNLAGVVWHPERMTEPWLPDEIQNLLFKDTK